MERLWSPWRHAYVTRSSDDEACVFCEAQVHDEGRALIVDEGPTCFVILNLYPYTSGHLMIVPKRHVGTLAALDRAELIELAELTRRSEMALTEAYQHFAETGRGYVRTSPATSVMVAMAAGFVLAKLLSGRSDRY